MDKPYQELDFSEIENNVVRCPDIAFAKAMEQKILETRKRR